MDTLLGKKKKFSVQFFKVVSQPLSPFLYNILSDFGDTLGLLIFKILLYHGRAIINPFPASNNISLTPGLRFIDIDSENNVIVIAHNGIAHHINREGSDQPLNPLGYPFSTVVIAMDGRYANFAGAKIRHNFGRRTYPHHTEKRAAHNGQCSDNRALILNR